MSASIHRPGAPLRELVDWFWCWDGEGAEAPKERVLPSGAFDLVINLSNEPIRIFDRQDRSTREEFEGPILFGARSRYLVIGKPLGTPVMGIHFRPGGAFPFLGVAAGELDEACVPLEALWAARARSLHDELVEARTMDQRFRVLESSLLAHPRRPLRRHPVVAAALDAFEDPSLRSVSELNSRLGISARRLISLFHEEVGLGPKSMWRVRRFQAALRVVDSDPSVRGAALAANLGYYDQAHFNRDFREFVGLNPSAYLAQGVERPNHVPLHT